MLETTGLSLGSDAERIAFLRDHVEDVYRELTDDCRRAVRDEDLVYAAAERFPGLDAHARADGGRAGASPARQDRGRDRPGPLRLVRARLAALRRAPRAGRCCGRPTEALERLDDFRATGVADLGGTYLERRGRGRVHRDPERPYLNAEDSLTLPTTEVAVDLALLDPEVELGVIRGAVVSHPRYAGRRVFGAGVNLTHLYHGRVDFMFFVTRDLGYVNKLFRGLSRRGASAGRAGGDDREAVDRRRRDVRDRRRVPAPAHGRPRDRERGARLFLPARKEGILPGASNLRLPRSVGERLARQAILSGLEFEAGTPNGDLLIDEVVEDGRDGRRDRALGSRR